MTAFWVGFMARATIAWGIEQDHNRAMGMTAPGIATVGLFAAALTLVLNASMLVIAWSGVLAVAGWMMVAAVMRIGVEKAKRQGWKE